MVGLCLFLILAFRRIPGSGLHNRQINKQCINRQSAKGKYIFKPRKSQACHWVLSHLVSVLGYWFSIHGQDPLRVTYRICAFAVAKLPLCSSNKNNFMVGHHHNTRKHIKGLLRSWRKVENLKVKEKTVRFGADGSCRHSRQLFCRVSHASTLCQVSLGNVSKPFWLQLSLFKWLPFILDFIKGQCF